MLSQLIRHLKSRLLLPILITVLVVIVLQVMISLFVTQRSVDVLVDRVLATLATGDQQIRAGLDDAQQQIKQATKSLSEGAESALENTLTEQLNQEKRQVEELLVASVQDTANAMANLMALVAPNAIWDGNSPELTRLVNDLHRNEMVLFARYYDREGKPLTRFLDKRQEKISNPD